jgi:hypothetical protein
LDSYEGVAVNKPVSVAGAGGIGLTMNDGGKGGMLLFGQRGHIGFSSLSSPLTINGTYYTLVNSIASLASAANANPAGAYALASDYDARNDGPYREPPVNQEFTGSFEGLGNRILRFSMRAEKNGLGGLFAANSSSGNISGLVLQDVNIHVRGGGQKYHSVAGGISAENFGEMADDFVSGKIEGSSDETGGVVGGNEGTISDSGADVQIVTSITAGGLAGFNSGSILRSYAEGSIVCGGNAGNCSLAGGLVGYDVNYEGVTTLIAESFATTSIVGTGGTDGALLGGLVGEVESGNGPTMVTDSYATGSVSGNYFSVVAGFIGETNDAGGDSMVVRSYSTGALTLQGTGCIGGFAGQVGIHDARHDYWDTTTSGTSEAECGSAARGVRGLTTTQLQAGLPRGFDPKIWAESPDINNGFPYLIANPPPATKNAIHGT